MRILSSLNCYVVGIDSKDHHGYKETVYIISFTDWTNNVRSWTFCLPALTISPSLNVFTD